LIVVAWESRVSRPPREGEEALRGEVREGNRGDVVERPHDLADARLIEALDGADHVFLGGAASFRRASVRLAVSAYLGADLCRADGHDQFSVALEKLRVRAD